MTTVKPATTGAEKPSDWPSVQPPPEPTPNLFPAVSRPPGRPRSRFAPDAATPTPLPGLSDWLDDNAPRETAAALDDAHRALLPELASIASTQLLRQRCQSNPGLPAMLGEDNALDAVAPAEAEIFRDFIASWKRLIEASAGLTVSGAVAVASELQNLASRIRHLRARRARWLRQADPEDLFGRKAGFGRKARSPVADTSTVSRPTWMRVEDS